MGVRFEGSQAILRVDDLKRALGFYVDVLGFTPASWIADNFTAVNRDGARMYLCDGAQGRGGAWVWIGVEDAQQLFEEWKDRDVKIVMPPTNFPWALEMQIEDPDSNVLRLGSEPLAQAPS